MEDDLVAPEEPDTDRSSASFTLFNFVVVLKKLDLNSQKIDLAAPEFKPGNWTEMKINTLAQLIKNAHR